MRTAHDGDARVGASASVLELTTGCPGAVAREPLAAVDECRTRGVHHVTVPASAFLPGPEAHLTEFGQRVVPSPSDP